MSESLLKLYIDNDTSQKYSVSEYSSETKEYEQLYNSDQTDLMIKKMIRQKINESDDSSSDSEQNLLTATKQKETIKTSTPSVVSVAKNEAMIAAKRTAAKQLVKLVREPLVAAIGDQFGDDPTTRKKIGKFLNTQLGEALVSIVLSFGISMLPGMPVANMQNISKDFADELRVKGMTDVGEFFAELMMGPMREIISSYIAASAQTDVEVAKAPAQLAENNVVNMAAVNQTKKKQKTRAKKTASA